MRAVAAPGDAEPTEVLDDRRRTDTRPRGALSPLTTVVDDADDVRTRAGLVALFDAIEATGDDRPAAPRCPRWTVR
ncbi:MAG: hypothetical protein U5R31_05385 [Acidimicrobiia bacterium]|nr:hypothetical protein [Acidimicrobiia bacterium]